jgi:hypothetical protein
MDIKGLKAQRTIKSALISHRWDGTLASIEYLAIALAFAALDSDEDHDALDVAEVFHRVSEIIIQLDMRGEAKM